MVAGGAHTRREDVRGLDVVGSVLLLANLAVAQPVLDLLSRNAAFFTDRQAPPGDIVILAVVLALAVPAAIVVVVLVVRRLLPVLGAALHLAVLTVLAGAFALQLLARSTPLPFAARATAAALVGIAFGLAFLRAPSVRTVMRWGVLVPVAVLGFFLLASPVSRLVLPARAADAGAEATRPVPVVVLLFDELPTSSLVGGDGGIDAELLPGFARLADEFTWFRNATTRYDHTHRIVPALLTGRRSRDVEPIAANYPDNLFSLVGDDYDVAAQEHITWFCTPDICDGQRLTDAETRLPSLLSDVSIVAQHVVLPEPLTGHLPPIDQAWGGFGEGAGVELTGEGDDARSGGLESFRDFLASVREAPQRSLRYFHTITPHHPFQRLPDGTAYTEDRGLPGLSEDKVWSDEPRLVAQGHQRHLLQVGVADLMVGDLLDALHAWPHYDEALVVVLADHGVSFTPGTHLRIAGEATAAELAHVPLFLKVPGQASGGVDERPASVLDVVPTVADVVGAADVGPFAGRSLLDAPDPDRRRELENLRGDTFPLAPDGKALSELVDRKLELIGTTGGWGRVYRAGPSGQLVGRSVGDGVDVGEPESAAVAIDDAEAFSDVDLDDVPLPAYASGTLEGAPPGTELAVAVNGEVAATTTAFEQDGDVRFTTVLAPSPLVDGDNDVAVFRIADGPGGSEVLHPVRG